MSTTSWPIEFAKVISCTACSVTTDGKILRDTEENLPQPGYVGENYWKHRVVLVGQNPGTPKTLERQDQPYTAALRRLREAPSDDKYQELHKVLQSFIPQWPVHGNYFPLDECGLSLQDIAYFNVVRCRTSGDAKPGINSVNSCLNNHFGRWLDNLAPRVVVFIGKWAADRASQEVARRGIPLTFMNRQRSLSSLERIQNRRTVVQLVRAGDT
ncbi:MAG: Uracil glycosylase superfamily [Pseudomonadota bacterium]|jgi:uracil-DNA glycosylase